MLSPFRSLQNLVSILENEVAYKIQIITFEPVSMFTTAMSSYKIKYTLSYTSLPTLSQNVNILLRDSEVPLLTGKIILYSNIREPAYAHFVWKISLEEKLNYSKDEYSVNMHKDKPLGYILKKNTDIYKLSAGSLDYIESVIMFAMVHKSKFKDLIDTVKSIDPNAANSFVIQMKLNGLVNKMFVTRSNDLYKINVSRETIREICSGIGFDINKL